MLAAAVVLTPTVGATAASGAGARASSFIPDCVRPGATTSQTIDYGQSANQVVAKGETVLVPSIVRGGRLDSLSLPKSSELPQGLAPMTYTPGAMPGLFDRTFAQAVTVPTTLSYAGGVAVGYVTFVNQYGEDRSTFFGNSGSAGFVGIDLKRVIIGARTLRVRKSLGDVRLAIDVTGFRRAQTYAHIVSAKGRLLRHVKLSRAASGNTCGDRRDEILFNGATPGTWTVVVNTSRNSRSATRGAVGTIKVTR